MRQIALDITLTEAEVRNLLLAIEAGSVFEDDETDENWKPLYDLADTIRAELPYSDHILHDSNAVRSSRGAPGAD